MAENGLVNGVSKKFSVFMSCISGVLGLAANAENKLPYAYLVVGMFAVYQAGQGYLDWLKGKKGGSYKSKPGHKRTAKKAKRK